MNITNMKNIVVLKNLPSNLVEEAIVVLKANKKIKKLEYINKKSEIKSEGTESKDYIIKEAEMIIANFISTVENPVNKNYKNITNVAVKYRRLKIVTIMLGVLTIVNLIINFMF